MPTPRDLFSKVRRPVKTEPDAPPPAPPAPVVRDRIERRTFHPDGSVTVYAFDPLKGESERTLSAEEAATELQPVTSPTPGIEAQIVRPDA